MWPYWGGEVGDAGDGAVGSYLVEHAVVGVEDVPVAVFAEEGVGDAVGIVVGIEDGGRVGAVVGA
jgi:hypothetical protein